MVVFSLPVSFSNQPHLSIEALLFRCQNKIAKKNFRIYFPLLIPITTMRTPRKNERVVYISCSTFFLSPSVCISATKVKAHEENSVYKDQKLPENLNGLN